MTEQLFNKTPCGIFCFSDNGNLLHANDTLFHILSLAAADVLGKNVETLFTLPTRIFFQTHFFPLVKMHGHAEEIFLTLRTATGDHLPVLLNATRIEWEEQPLTCCAFIVVPNRKKFEDELVNARKAAEKMVQENTELVSMKAQLQQHAEKLEEQMQLVKSQNRELQQFSHAVTHNLKEPLRKILIYTGKLQAEHVSPNVEKLVKANEQMKIVLSSLQQYVWLNEKKNHIVPLHLGTVVEAARQQLFAEMNTAALDLQVGHLDALEGDAEQLQLLFYHLLANTVQFRRGEKATVRIHSQVLKQNKFQSLDNRYQYEDYVRVEVEDEGIGFDNAYSEYIFELFKKMHFSGGQGLGLALCKTVVENHHGKIAASSEINAFTRITLWLPVNQYMNEMPR